MKKAYKIKPNQKKYAATISYLEEKIGIFDTYVELESNNGYPFRVLIKEPTEQKPYYMLVTAGLQFIKFPHFGKNLEGFELFMRLPTSWKFPEESTDKNAWAFHILEGIVSIIIDGSVMLPGMTYQFEKFTSDTKQHIAMVHYSQVFGEEPFVLPLKKKDVVFLEVQTLYDEEFNVSKDDDGDVAYYVYTLPYIDLYRECFILDKKESEE